MESFNGKLRDELLNGEIFYILKETKVVIERWRQEFNRLRPHSSLGYRPPASETIWLKPAPLPSCPKTQTNSRLARRAVFDRHRLVASPSSGACRRRCRRFGFPVRAGKTPSSNGMPRSRAETWIQARAAHGPERASWLRRGSPGLDSGPLGRPLFRRCTALSATRSPPFGANVALENRD